MAEKSSQAERILGIIYRLLNSPEGIDIKALADEYNVSKRTLERDIKKLLEFPAFNIQKNQNGKYCLVRQINEDGHFSFSDIRKFAKKMSADDILPSLDDFAILDTINPNNTSYTINPQAREQIKLSSDDFDELNGAILAHNKISFDYHGKNRTIEPYGLTHTNGIWYLIGTQKNQLRNFTVSEISNLIIKKEFTPSLAIQRKIKENDLQWFSANPQTAELLISPQKRKYFDRKKLFRNLEILKDDENGILIRTKYAFDAEILNTVRAWIPYIKIISPSKLRTKLKKELQNYLEDI